ncbi:MAG: hypothetical protein ACF8GE_11830 [Phycisphaerales bacterium JB043]
MKSRSVAVALVAGLLSFGGEDASGAMWHFEFLGTQSVTGGDVDVWDMFIELDAPARVLNVFEANLSTSGTIYQTGAPFGSDTAPNSGFFGFDADLQWDSFVTIGDADSADGNDTTTDPDFAFGSNTISGGWFDSNPSTHDGQTDANNRAYAGRISLIAGARAAAVPFLGDAFVTYVTPSDDLIQEYIIPYPTPGTGVLMLAGLGVASRRHRED